MQTYILQENTKNTKPWLRTTKWFVGKNLITYYKVVCWHKPNYVLQDSSLHFTYLVEEFT